MKTQVSILSALIFIFLQLFSTPTLQAQAQLPNIVFIIIDDLGMSTIPTYANKDGGAEGWISALRQGLIQSLSALLTLQSLENNQKYILTCMPLLYVHLLEDKL